MIQEHVLQVILSVLLWSVQEAQVSSGESSNMSQTPDLIQEPEEWLEQLLGPNGSYNAKLRPRPAGKGGSGATHVDLEILILSISGISVLDMEFTMDLFLRQTWYDERLKNDFPKASITLKDDKVFLMLSYEKKACLVPAHTL